jgi:hypothetical protein
MDFFYHSERFILVKRYFHWCITIDDTVLYDFYMIFLCTSLTRLIRVRIIATESISEFFVPVSLREDNRFFWCSGERWLVCIKMTRRKIDTSENEESTECLEPLSSTSWTFSGNRMFHNLYKKNKIIITYKILFVNIF